MAQQNPWEYMWDLKDFIPLPLQINQLIAGLHAFNHCDTQSYPRRNQKGNVIQLYFWLGFFLLFS